MVEGTLLEIAGWIMGICILLFIVIPLIIMAAAVVVKAQDYKKEQRDPEDED